MSCTRRSNAVPPPCASERPSIESSSALWGPSKGSASSSYRFGMRCTSAPPRCSTPRPRRNASLRRPTDTARPLPHCGRSRGRRGWTRRLPRRRVAPSHLGRRLTSDCTTNQTASQITNTVLANIARHPSRSAAPPLGRGRRPIPEHRTFYSFHITREALRPGVTRHRRTHCEDRRHLRALRLLQQQQTRRSQALRKARRM